MQTVEGALFSGITLNTASKAVAACLNKKKKDFSKGETHLKKENVSDFMLKEESAENLICSLHWALRYYAIKVVTVFTGPSEAILNYTERYFIP